MRLPARIAPCVFVLSLGVAAAQNPPELQGGGLQQPPPQITRVDAATGPQTTEAAPQPFGYESEVHCFGYIGYPNEPFVASVIGAENSAEQTDFTDGDLLYLDAGADRGIKPGDEFWLITPGDEVIHPVSGQDMGRFYEQRGRVRVLCIEGRTATVQVTSACTDIPMGSFLKPYEPVPIPLGRRLPACAACDPPSGKVNGSIVFTRDGVVAIGADTDVLIDLGVAEGVQPGDQFAIYRHATGTDYGLNPQGAYWVYTPPPAGMEIPRTYLGDLAILYVGDRWAMGRVIDSKKLIGVGDQVELK
jgi:hypothetical protein